MVEQQRLDGQVRRLLSIVTQEQLPRVLRYMLDEEEFLSPLWHPLAVARTTASIPTCSASTAWRTAWTTSPRESTTGLFGGNSNWRGPIWFPVNFLLIESLQKFHYFYGDVLAGLSAPAGSGVKMDPRGDRGHRPVAPAVPPLPARRHGRRPVFGADPKHQEDPHWRDLVPFHEYFHGETGAGLGASHQTGWTGLVAKLLEQSGE